MPCGQATLCAVGPPCSEYPKNVGLYDMSVDPRISLASWPVCCARSIPDTKAEKPITVRNRLHRRIVLHLRDFMNSSRGLTLRLFVSTEEESNLNRTRASCCRI